MSHVVQHDYAVAQAVIPLAFYAPLKAPDHPVVSGDRTMARQLMQVLTRAGFAPRLASRLRAYEPTGLAGPQEKLHLEAAAETARLLEEYRRQPELRPSLWLTYHCYYKAADRIGPVVARALGIPYVIVEGSRAPRRANGRLALGHAASEAALDVADLVFVMTSTDKMMLERFRPAHQQLVDLPPFVEVAPEAAQAQPGQSDEPHLLTVAMMRPGDKLASFQQLAQALDLLGGRPWRLTIAGDGEAREDVQGLFAQFGARVAFAGAVAGDGPLEELYAAADLLVWPAVNEAYGMAFLEAAAHGLPALAGRYGGVASVVRDGETGVLTERGDVAGFAAALSALLDDRDWLQVLGRQARAFVENERSLEHAATIMRGSLLPLVRETARS